MVAIVGGEKSQIHQIMDREGEWEPGCPLSYLIPLRKKRTAMIWPMDVITCLDWPCRYNPIRRFHLSGSGIVSNTWPELSVATARHSTVPEFGGVPVGESTRLEV